MISLAGIFQLLLALLLIVLGIIVIVFLVKLFIVLLPAAIVALIVWFLTKNELLAAIAFLVVAAISLFKLL